MNWQTIEQAIRSWVKTGGSLSDEQIRFADQKVAKYNGTFVTIRLGDMVAIGTRDYESRVYAASPAGAELTHTFRGEREFTASIQAFTDSTVSTSSAWALLSTIQNALSLPAIRTALNAATLGLIDAGTVRNVSALVGTGFEGRAILEVRFRAASTATETSTYISTVNAEDYSGPPLGDPDTIDI